MDFYEVIKTRRSIREYTDKPIPDEVLERVLNAARIAPSGGNHQPTRLIVLKDPDAIKALAEIYCGEEYRQAPVIIVACGKVVGFNRGQYMGDYSMLMDVAVAMDHLILAARAEGLATCWKGSFDNAVLKPHFGIPENFQIVALTALGYPEGNPFVETDKRIPLNEFVCENKWCFE